MDKTIKSISTPWQSNFISSQVHDNNQSSLPEHKGCAVSDIRTTGNLWIVSDRLKKSPSEITIEYNCSSWSSLYNHWQQPESIGSRYGKK